MERGGGGTERGGGGMERDGGGMERDGEGWWRSMVNDFQNLLIWFSSQSKRSC